jgi:parallel beta-helix repeat protein
MTKSFTTLTIAFLFFSGFILLCSTSDARGTDVTSDITGNTTWTISGSPYIVKQNVTVTGGNTLTIQAGVVVKFSGYLSLSISGALVVSGIPAGRVIFTYDSSTPTAGSWEGLRFLANSDDTGSSITSADILYASNGLYLDHSSPAIYDIEVSSSLRKGINIFQSSPLINNCRIKNGLGTGIKSSGGSPTIQDSEISGHANGLELIDSDAAIQRNLIESNGIGLLLNSSSPFIVDNDFTLNEEGIQADFNSHPSLEGNTFNTNSKTGLWVLDRSSATLLEDVFTGNGVAIEIEDSEVFIDSRKALGPRSGTLPFWPLRNSLFIWSKHPLPFSRTPISMLP